VASQAAIAKPSATEMTCVASGADGGEKAITQNTFVRSPSSCRVKKGGNGQEMRRDQLLIPV
jgi:hypothetical protein